MYLPLWFKKLAKSWVHGLLLFMLWETFKKKVTLNSRLN